MMFQKAPSNSQKLLDEIISSENSVSLLRDKLKKPPLSRIGN